MKRASRYCAVALLALVGLVAIAGSTSAQEPPQLPPLPTLPTPPEQLDPAFELVSPMVHPACGTAILAIFVVATGQPDLTSTLFTATDPLFVICGEFPRPPVQLNCLIDEQIALAINAVASQAGAPIPPFLHPGGDITQQTITIEDNLPPPANSAQLGPQAANLLGCVALNGPAAPSPDDDFESPPLPPNYVPPAPGPIANFPPLPQPDQGQLPPTNAVAQQPSRSQALVSRVKYGAVWLLPFALLALGLYLGGSATREIEFSPPAST